jgi:hypothetical protein
MSLWNEQNAAAGPQVNQACMSFVLLGELLVQAWRGAACGYICLAPCSDKLVLEITQLRRWR